MKKQIIAAGTLTVVENAEELLSLMQDIKLTDLVTIYNGLVPAEQQVKKFSDKKAAAKRLFTVLPEASTEPVVKQLAKKTGQPNSVKSILRSLYSVAGAHYTLDELLAACKCQKKVLMDDIARLKNPAYAGKGGTIEIYKHASFGVYVASPFDEEAYVTSLPTEFSGDDFPAETPEITEESK